MKLTLQSILNFPEFFPLTTTTRLPIKTAYKLSRLATAVEQEINFYRTKLREILAEYCQKDEEGNYIPTADGQGFRIIEGKEAECRKAMEELDTLEVELPDIMFDIEEFEGLELKISELNGIMPFIKE